MNRRYCAFKFETVFPKSSYNGFYYEFSVDIDDIDSASIADDDDEAESAVCDDRCDSKVHQHQHFYRISRTRFWNSGKIFAAWFR